MLKLIAFITLLSTNLYAQAPTVVYGESELPDGKIDSYLIKQPYNAPNPLGDPIVSIPQEQNDTKTQTSDSLPEQTDSSSKDLTVNQIAEQNPPPFAVSPETMQNKIENTLYQGGNRIYDIQSYPLEDINKITEPNINPTITTYPEY